MCFSRELDLAVSTTAAARVRPDSRVRASPSAASTDCALPTEASWFWIDCALRLGEVADLHQGIDEEPQAEFGRQPAGRGMRRVDQAELLEIRHHVAHRGRRQRHRDQARNVAGTDGFAGGEITLDDLTKNVPRTLVELGKPGMRSDQADRIVVGHRILRLTQPNLSITGSRGQAGISPHRAGAWEAQKPCRCRFPLLQAPRTGLYLIFGGFLMRPSRRAPDELRAVSLERGVVKYAEGSCMVKFGDTHVLVTATLEERLPPWLKGQGRGWVTAEYGMLPRATLERTRREAAAGKQGGRTVEIQRLIGRSLRAVGRPRGARRAPDHGRLRRHPGRWRHPHRLDHRRLGGAGRLHRLDEDPQHDQDQPAARPCRGDLLRHLQRHRRCSISITPRIPRPTPTPISS